MYGTDWISRSSTIAKCWAQRVTELRSFWPWQTRAPRWASRRVMLWKTFLPLPVNCIVTIGAPDVESMSARVPESFNSLPVISGMGFSGKSEAL